MRTALVARSPRTLAAVVTVAAALLLATVPVLASTPPLTPAGLAAQITQAVATPTTADLTSQLAPSGHLSYRLEPCVQDPSLGDPGDRFTACDFGNPTAPRTVVLLGDSQAAMWLPAFDLLGKSHNFHVVLLARLGCNSNPLVLRSWLGTVDTQCAIFRTATLKYLKTLHAPAVFVSQQHQYPSYADGSPVLPAAWTASMSTLFASLKATGASSVSFIEPAPVDPTDAASCLARNLGASQSCTFIVTQGMDMSAYNSDNAAAASSHVTTVNTLGLFCNASKITFTVRCPAQVAAQVVYADRWHVTSRYATYVAPVLATLAKL